MILLKTHMMYNARIVPVFFILFVTWVHPVFSQNQTWEALSGHRFEGVFVGLNQNQVTLKGPEREVTLPLDTLSPASRQLAVAASSAKGGEVFYSETGSYRLRLLQNRFFAEIHFLEHGREVLSEPVRLAVNHHEIPGSYVYRGLKELDGPPVIDGDQVFLRLRMANDVIIAVHLILKQDSIDVGYHMELPKGSLPKLSAGVSLHYPEVLPYDEKTKLRKGSAAPDGIPWERVEAHMREYSLQYRSYSERRSINIGFVEKVSGSFHRLESCMIRTPLSKANLRIQSLSSSEVGSLNFWFYDGSYLMDGFRIRLSYSELPIGNTPPGMFRIRFI